MAIPQQGRALIPVVSVFFNLFDSPTLSHSKGNRWKWGIDWTKKASNQ